VLGSHPAQVWFGVDVGWWWWDINCTYQGLLQLQAVLHSDTARDAQHRCSDFVATRALKESHILLAEAGLCDIGYMQLSSALKPQPRLRAPELACTHFGGAD